MNWVTHEFEGFSIRLPEQLIGAFANESDYYGARKALCEYAGLDSEKYSLEWIWQHGWIRDRLLVDPAIILTSKHSAKRNKSFLVANRQQQEYLRQHGYHKVKAAGMPIIYAPPPEPSLKRIPNSLLVMPMHSLESTRRKSNFDDYAALVNELKKDFVHVLVCLHYSCIKNDFWMKEFERYQIPWIEGANLFDQNCMSRLQAFFCQFEYVTTNGYGSHLPYSAYFGAKTSVYGEFPRREPKDYVNDKFFRQFPHLFKIYFPLLEEEVIREDMPFLFCHPTEAQQHQAWGRQELGSDYKLSREEARKLFISNKLLNLRHKVVDTPRKKLNYYFSKITNR
jgi:hypothetical protein